MEKERAVESTAKQHKKLELGSEEVINDKDFISAATVQTVVWILWALITGVALPQQSSPLWGCIGIPSALSRHLASRERPMPPSSSTISATSTGPSLTSQPGIEEPEIYGAAQQANVPRNLAEALSPRFAPEYGPALQKEMQGFVEHECFEQVELPDGRRCLPTQIIFSRKSDGTPKVRFVIGGHMQQDGRDFYAFETYCSVLSSRDNRLLLAIAAANKWEIAQTDISQAFLEGKLDDVDIFIKAPPGYPCAPNKVLKLKRAVYGLRQAPVTFKKEVTDWFRAKGYAVLELSRFVAEPFKAHWQAAKYLLRYLRGTRNVCHSLCRVEA